MPLEWYTGAGSEVRSLHYLSPTTHNTTSCNPIQFQFYNSENQNAGAAYLTPGQRGRGCVDFYNGIVVGYRGVTLLVPGGVPAWGAGQ
jgi:hypothetical protein